MSDRTRVESAAGQWTILRAGPRDSGGLEVPSIPLHVASSAGPLRLAVGPGGEARLLLPLEAQEELAGIDVDGALVVSVSSFLQGRRAHRFLDIVCLAVDLEPVFGNVVDEIIKRVSSGCGCVEAARTTLEDFRTLLASSSTEQVQRTRVAGLIGELVVLNRLLALSPSAWRSWRGPAGDRHDFRAADTSLEVKASIRAGSVQVTINGLEQLEPPRGGTLHLAHFVLEPVFGGLLTIAGLGRQALERADDTAGLRALLAGVGCPDVQNEAWNRVAFRLEREALYRVDGAFPRIVPSIFQAGITLAGVHDVTYVVDLSLASGGRCDVHELDSLLRTLAR